jgi:hypothetical protein
MTEQHFRQAAGFGTDAEGGHLIGQMRGLVGAAQDVNRVDAA